MEYNIYPKKYRDIEDSNVLVIWNSSVSMTGGIVKYNDKQFDYSKIVKDPLFPNSYIFIK